MSQCYQVQLKEAVTRVVKGEDSISYPIELTQILPEDEMTDLLKQELIAAGWKPRNNDETIFEIEGPGGEMLTLDLEEMELTATISVEKEVTAEASAIGRSERGDSQARIEAEKALQGEASAIGDRIEDAGTKELQIEVTEALANSESDRQRSINELLQRVYTESLKRKAGQLGEVMEVSESTSEDGNYELTIRIEQ